MKKILALSFGLFLATGAFAQTTTTMSAAPAGSTVVQPSKGSTIPADCYVNKTWKLNKVEKFGVAKDPTAEQKGDMLQLNQNGTFKMILNGAEKAGTWTRGVYMTLQPKGGAALLVKIVSCDTGALKVDWKDGDTHNFFMYAL